MTIDVTIGKISSDKTYITKCPRAERNICNPQYTNHERDSYRSGSSKFRQFWQTSCGEFYNRLEHEITPLKPHIDTINNLVANGSDVDRDRMVWFKYWANKAVDMYGENAGIRFD